MIVGNASFGTRHDIFHFDELRSRLDLRIVLRHDILDFQTGRRLLPGRLGIFRIVCMIAGDVVLLLLVLLPLRCLTGGLIIRRHVPAAARQETQRIHRVLGHVAFVRGFHVILHFVWTRELLLAHWTREHLPLGAFVVEERMPLEAVFVFECLLNVLLCAFRALVDSLKDFRVTEQIQTPDRHLGQMFGLIVGG